MATVPLKCAAAELGLSLPTLKRNIRAGAPVAKRGRRGRGCATLIDPAAFAAWRRSRATPAHDDRLLVITGELPELIAATVYECFIAMDGPHKRACASELAKCWFLVTTAVLDRLRTDRPDVPELDAVPEKINALRSIFTDASRTTSPSNDSR